MLGIEDWIDRRRCSNTSFPPLIWDVYASLPSGLRKHIIQRRHKSIWEMVPEDKPLFVHIPKTAGTTLATRLYGRTLNHYPWWVWSDANPRRFEGAVTFSVLREPCERFVSAIRHCLGAPVASPLEREAGHILREYGRTVAEMCCAYLSCPHLRKQLRRIVHFKSQAYWIGRLEELGVDEVFALRERTSDPRQIESLNVNSGVERLEKMPKSLRDQVYDLYRDDFELYYAIDVSRQIDDVLSLPIA